MARATDDSTRSPDISFFSHATDVMTSGGQFYGIGRDYITIHNYSNSTRNPDQTEIIADKPGDQLHPRSLIISPEERQSVLVILSSDIHSLFSQVASLLNHQKVLRTFGILKPELELLEQTLVATAFGIKAFRATRIGYHLAEIIKPMLGQCVTVLRDLSDVVDAYRQCLSPFIYDLWRLVWDLTCEVSELESWRNRLLGCRSRLAMVVMALQS